jgi:hypothetical protein
VKQYDSYCQNTHSSNGHRKQKGLDKIHKMMLDNFYSCSCWLHFSCCFLKTLVLYQRTICCFIKIAMMMYLYAGGGRGLPSSSSTNAPWRRYSQVLRSSCGNGPPLSSQHFALLLYYEYYEYIMNVVQTRVQTT